MTHTLDQAQYLDQQDELAHFRKQFIITDPDLVYLDGNSLGRLPKATQALLDDLIAQQWGAGLISGWPTGWMDAPRRVGGKIAGLIGAQADEVIVADSTSVNLYKLALAALIARPERRKIITDDLNFPSDLYILQGLQGLSRLVDRPIHIEVVPSPDGIHGPLDGLAQAIDDDTALVTLSHTAFKSGYVYDATAVTTLAHQAGALMLWDLSHSAGSVPVQLNASNADLAVGCTYKYLNGGPGAPAFLYVRRELQGQIGNPISGWMGQQQAFDFDLTYEPVADNGRYLTGTPAILSLSAIEPGVDILLEAGIDALRAKSVQQTEYLIALYDEFLAPLGFTLNSPRDVAQRGSHVSIGHEEGWRIDQALINEMNVLPDFRQPDNLRLGIAPLYTRYVDLWTAVARLRTVMVEKRYEKYSKTPTSVT